MPEAHESMEHAEHAEHAAHSNRKVGLVIAILALFLSFSEMPGKSAQTEAIGANVEASNLWSFFQAKTVRMTMVRTATEQLKLTAEATSDPATRAATRFAAIRKHFRSLVGLGGFGRPFCLRARLLFAYALAQKMRLLSLRGENRHMVDSGSLHGADTGDDYRRWHGYSQP
jgi:hypothetical protein